MAKHFTIPTVTKPFPSFKWRWMEFVPQESFNRPDILLGVTRAVAKCEGKSASSPEFQAALKVVQKDLLPGGKPKLVPSDPQRNVIRRQGRYWRGLGILASSSKRVLALTRLGRKWAEGALSNDEFVAHTVRHHSLPGLLEGRQADLWQEAGIILKPLRLILEVLLELRKTASREEAYLTTVELRDVLVPLSIVERDARKLAEAVLAFRKDPSGFEKLPNCAPDANDVRMLHEHLLFLHHFGWLSRSEHARRDEERFAIPSSALRQIADALKIKEADLPSPQDEDDEIAEDPGTGTVFVPDSKSRGKVAGTRPARDPRFKKHVLAHFRGKCLLTGEALKPVLIACHIHEVRDGGSDASSNGIILRSDLHILFDKNKLRISQDGDVVVSPDVVRAKSYVGLPKKVVLPDQVDKELLRLRFLYGRIIR